MQPHSKTFSACSPSMNRMKWVNMKFIWSQANLRRSFGLMSLTSTESIMTATREL
ncbi:hypothetical protein BX666DRAFT_2162509 [Dichotomocladium elegans]|nr:hypothetical protein BX666DRAFT_2162509 [Dichotomocladium elegans]